ncbi:TMEM175 family protein [Lactovum odontotermitis]
MNSDKVAKKVIGKIVDSESESSGMQQNESLPSGDSRKQKKQSFSERRRQSREHQLHRRFEKMQRDPEMRQARQELRDEFLETHQKFKDMTESELQAEMTRHAEEDEKIRRQKLRSHIETFSDSVIAVIITIMLLEIPIPRDGQDYLTFLSAVGIFLISFMVIANFWFNHHKIFAVTEEITEGTIVQDFFFIGLLSLLPLLTKWIIAQPTWFSSLNYGIVILLILSQQEMLNFSITRDHFKKMPKSFKFWKKIWMARFMFTMVINIIITVVAVLFPLAGHWLFVIVPVFSFLSQLFVRDQEHEWQSPGDRREVGVPYLK